jgi:signal transduction histidine kinase
VANPDVRAEPAEATFSLARRNVAIAVGAAGVAAAVGGGVLVATSDHLARPLAYGLQIATIVAGTVGVALYWAVRRPANRIALVLLAYAAAAAGMALQGASNPLLHSVGVLCDAPMFLLGYYLVFIFPSGRLEGVAAKVLTAAIACALLVSFVPWFFFSPVVSGGAPLAGCTAACPTNALMIASEPSIADGFGKAEEYFSVIVGSAIALALVHGLVRASRPRRHSLLPVYLPALLVTVPFVLFHSYGAGLVTFDFDTLSTIGWFLTAGRTALTFGFLVAIWQAMLLAGVALTTIMRRVGEEADAARLRSLVADALDDSSLELAFEVDRGGAMLVDSHGDPVDVRDPGRGRTATPLRRHGETIAYIVHDRALETDPELVEAAGQAVLLALEGGRLDSELQSKIAELRRSNARIVSAGEAERRRIERDLHDGAQQRLMGIQIKLGLLRDRIDEADLVSELDEIEEDANAAVDELRSLAHGIYPTVLRERGLGDGVRSLARTAPVRVDVVDAGIGRCSPLVEAMLYFCLVEAIQNATKHAGAGSRVSVTLERIGNEVQFVVADDGAGFDPAQASEGVGLRSMRDRIGAVGGVLEIVSSPGVGTRVCATVPDDASVHA